MWLTTTRTFELWEESPVFTFLEGEEEKLLEKLSGEGGDEGTRSRFLQVCLCRGRGAYEHSFAVHTFQL